VLGISPTCEPELIDAAYQALARKYGDGGDRERMSAIHAAYDQLKDGAAAEAALPVIGAAMWQVRPRRQTPEPASSAAAEKAASDRLTAARTTNPGPAKSAPAPAPEPSFTHDPPAGATRTRANGPARHWTLSDCSADNPPSPDAPHPPTDDLAGDPMPDGQHDRSRLAIPVAGGVAILGAALLTIFLVDRPPVSPPSAGQRKAASPVQQRPLMGPQAKTAFQTPDRIDTAARIESRPQSPLPAAGRDTPKAGETTREIAPAQQASIAPTKLASRTSPTPTKPSLAAPVPSIAPSNITATPTPAAVPAPAAAMPPRQQEPPQPAIAMPARWISGGLQDSDNRNGRFAGSVAVRITVRPNGRAGRCRIARSSGNPHLDQTTCYLVGERLLFSPAQDAAGRAVESEVSTTYVWGRRERR
jgi:protein TonB